eukprot:1115595-Pyramimonas_sp.AAC.1
MTVGIAHHGASFGFYVPSCLSHGADNGKFIGAHASMAVIAAWYAADVTAPNATAAAAAYQLMDGYGRGPTPQCNPSCGGRCECDATALSACPGGCGDPAAGVILGFGGDGALDPSKDLVVENLVVAKNCSSPGTTCGAQVALAFNESCGPTGQVRGAQEVRARL